MPRWPFVAGCTIAGCALTAAGWLYQLIRESRFLGGEPR